MSKRLPRRDGAHVWRRARREEALLGLSPETRLYILESSMSKVARPVMSGADVRARTIACGPVWMCSRCGKGVRSRGRPGHFRKPLCKDTVVETVMET